MTTELTPRHSHGSRPGRDRIKALVLDAIPSPHSRRAYAKGLLVRKVRRYFTDFLAWYQAEACGDGFTKATVQRYARRLAEQACAVDGQCSADGGRRLAAEAADNGWMAPELVAAPPSSRFNLASACLIQTTGRYLGVRQDLQDAPCDH